MTWHMTRHIPQFRTQTRFDSWRNARPVVPHKFALAAAVAIALVIAASAAAALETAGDAQLGRAYAEKHCAQCHSIEAGAKTSLVIGAPPLAQLVNHKRLTTKAIDGWLRSSHRGMPTPAIAVEDRANLVAYIKSLALK